MVTFTNKFQLVLHILSSLSLLHLKWTRSNPSHSCIQWVMCWWRWAQTLFYHPLLQESGLCTACVLPPEPEYFFCHSVGFLWCKNPPSFLKISSWVCLIFWDHRHCCFTSCCCFQSCSPIHPIPQSVLSLLIFLLYLPPFWTRISECILLYPLQDRIIYCCTFSTSSRIDSAYM